MSSLLIVPERQWYLSFGGLSLRNNQTVFLLGESTGGTGYKFDRKGIFTKLTLLGDVSGITGGPGTWSITVGLYTDGVAAGDKVFECSASGVTTTSVPISDVDTTADGGGPGLGYGTGTDIFVKVVSALGGFASATWAYNAVLEGTHVA